MKPEWKLNTFKSKVNRGYSVFECTVPHEGKSVDEVVEAISKFPCPGWTGIEYRGTDGEAYKFQTVWDSTD